MSSKVITISDRIGALEEIATRFKDHLIDVPGVTLSAKLRLLVAECARGAINCKACMEKLPRDGCLRPGAKVHDIVTSVQHNPSIAGMTGNPNAENVIMTIVHSVVNHQSRLDLDWYDDCIQALSKAGILPASIANEKRLYLLYSAFAEILCIALMSYCVNITFLTIGRPVPRLPSKEEIQNGKAQASGPLLLDWTAIFKKAPRRDENAFAYYFLAGDINKTSKEYMRISEGSRKNMEIWADPIHPSLCATFAAEDARMMSEMEDVYYIPAKSMMALFKVKLDPTIRCADHFTRFDAEFVASSIANATQCSY